MLDCCKSGFFGNQPEIGGITPIETGTTILTSSRKNEPSKEVNGHGVFTNLLIEGLKGGAADVRGHISPGGLYAFIDQALTAHEQDLFLKQMLLICRTEKCSATSSSGTIRKIT